MKKVKALFKNNIKLVLGIIIGLVIAGGSFAVYAITATSITYTDNYSIGATTVQGAIDKLYGLSNKKLKTTRKTETLSSSAYSSMTASKDCALFFFGTTEGNLKVYGLIIIKDGTLTKRISYFGEDSSSYLDAKYSGGTLSYYQNFTGSISVTTTLIEYS